MDIFQHGEPNQYDGLVELYTKILLQKSCSHIQVTYIWMSQAEIPVGLNSLK